MLVALNIIAAEKYNSTEATAKAVTELINYAVTQYEDITRYHTSGMILHIHSNASSLSDPGSKSRSVGYHYFSTASAYLLKHLPSNRHSMDPFMSNTQPRETS